MDNNTLKQLYLEDLESIVQYGEQQRSRVRFIKQWKDNINGVINNPNGPLDILSVMHNVHVWSDQHFGHKNIIRYSNRPFPHTSVMNEQLIEMYNEVVQPEDVCLWVGDVGFMSDPEINHIIKRCNGYKILIIGNHDFNKKRLRNLYAFDEIHLSYYFMWHDVEFAVTHYPMTNLPEPCINIHGHTHDRSLDSTQHINVSCEVTQYKPRAMMEVIKEGLSRAEELIG